jgi:hypothetical protein
LSGICLDRLANGAAHQQELMHERAGTLTNDGFSARIAVILHELRQEC